MELQQAQIDKWKKEHGQIYEINTDDGKSCVIFDPVSQFKIIKAATQALRSGDETEFVSVVLSNCFLAGDEVIKTEERYWMGIAEQLHRIAELPEAEVKEIGENTFELSSEGESVLVRKAKRKDVQESDRKNFGNISYASSEFLLGEIAKDEEQRKKIDVLRKAGGRAYLGLVIGTEKVVDKVRAGVKKL